MANTEGVADYPSIVFDFVIVICREQQLHWI